VAAVHAAVNQLFEDGRQQTRSNDMPKATATRTRAAANGQLWQPVIDAADSIKARFKDPNALEGMDAVATAADGVESLGMALKAVAEEMVATVKLDKRAAPLVEGLADYVLRAVNSTRDAGAAINRAHAEKIAELREGDARLGAWDYSRHNGNTRMTRPGVR
jgi:hypothetical protein